MFVLESLLCVKSCCSWVGGFRSEEMWWSLIAGRSAGGCGASAVRRNSGHEEGLLE